MTIDFESTPHVGAPHTSATRFAPGLRTSPTSTLAQRVAALLDELGAEALARRWVRGADGAALVVVAAPRRDVVPATDADEPSVVSALRAQGLTPREAQVALLLAQRLTNQEIADGLRISQHTVRHHTERVLCKLRLPHRRAVSAVVARFRATTSAVTAPSHGAPDLAPPLDAAHRSA